MFIKQNADGNDEDNQNENDNSSNNNEEDNSQADDNSDNTSGDDNEEGAGEGDDSQNDLVKLAFTNPNKLPKELVPYAKKLQAIATRKIQEASRSTKKAEAFDQLVQDPEFRNWIEQRQAGITKKTTSSKNNNSDNSEDDEDENTPVTRGSLQKVVEAALNKAMSPMLNQQRDNQIQAELKSLAKRHPDWEMYREDMAKVINKNPNLSLLEAYKLASMDDDSEDEDVIKTKKNANVSKPSKSGVAGDIKKKPEKAKTVSDAYALAKKMLKIG